MSIDAQHSREVMQTSVLFTRGRACVAFLPKVKCQAQTKCMDLLRLSMF